jgi:hypothetical protein
MAGERKLTEILEESDKVSKAGLVTRQERADEMLLTAVKGDPFGAVLYMKGKANWRWPLWRKTTVSVQDGWRKEILEEAAKVARHNPANKASSLRAGDLLSMLFEHAVHILGMPLGDLDTWTKRVFDASESVVLGPKTQHEKTPHPRSKERRILTALYQRYVENNHKKPEWLLRTHEPGLKKFFTVPGSGESSTDD